MRAKASATKAKQPPKVKSEGDQFAHLSDEERKALKDLAEVERAIAILEGREDANREDVAFARKEAERLRGAVDTALARIDQNLREARQARIRRGAAIVLTVVLVGTVAFLIVPRVQSWFSGRARSTQAAQQAAAPFVREGFVEIETSAGAAPLTVNAERGKCYVAVAGSAEGAARVRVERGPVSAEGASVGVCACSLEDLRFSTSGPEPIELRVLAAPDSVTGGADLLPILAAAPEARVAEAVDRRCAEESIDAFIAAHPPGGAGEPRETRVEALGLRRVASASAETPLVVLPAEKDTCFLAQSENEEDSLSLRLKGGERPVPIQRVKGAIALCGRSLAGVSVWREGRGEVTVFSAPAARVGGLLGMGDLSRVAGRTAALWAPAEDLAFDAQAVLLASGLAPLEPGESAVGPAAAPKGAGPRAAAPGEYALFLAVSTDAKSMLKVDERAPDAFCRPPVNIGVARSLCLEVRPGALGDAAGMPAGSARAKRPFWLPVARASRAQNERVLDVLAFARRMSVAGFELTSLTGFVEIPGGVEVTGRSGEKEIVALTVSQSPPYVHPLTEGPAWTLEGEPQVVQLPAGKSVKLKATAPFVGPRAGRETIIWRR